VSLLLLIWGTEWVEKPGVSREHADGVTGERREGAY
jgi:hypothetical protein